MIICGPWIKCWERLLGRQRAIRARRSLCGSVVSLPHPGRAGDYGIALSALCVRARLVAGTFLVRYDNPFVCRDRPWAGVVAILQEAAGIFLCGTARSQQVTMTWRQHPIDHCKSKRLARGHLSSDFKRFSLDTADQSFISISLRATLNTRAIRPQSTCVNTARFCISLRRYRMSADKSPPANLSSD